MEEAFQRLAILIALSLDTSAALIIGGGAFQAVYRSIRALTQRLPHFQRRKDVWLNFGVWLLLGLEFELGADIVRTAISPTWHDLGQLGTIAVIRTFLNYFLEKDLEKYGEPASASTADGVQKAVGVPSQRAA